jgi:hypothetical protein
MKTVRTTITPHFLSHTIDREQNFAKNFVDGLAHIICHSTRTIDDDRGPPQ